MGRYLLAAAIFSWAQFVIAGAEFGPNDPILRTSPLLSSSIEHRLTYLGSAYFFKNKRIQDGERYELSVDGQIRIAESLVIIKQGRPGHGEPGTITDQLYLVIADDAVKVENVAPTVTFVKLLGSEIQSWQERRKTLESSIRAGQFAEEVRSCGDAIRASLKRIQDEWGPY